MTGTNERSIKVANVWKIPEVQDLPVAAKLAIEMAFLAENSRGTEEAYRLGQVRGLRIAKNLPRFTFTALGKHITGYVGVTAIDAEIWKREGPKPSVLPD